MNSTDTFMLQKYCILVFLKETS